MARSAGPPDWTVSAFQPEFVVSYLKDGWNLTANIFEEFNTSNSITGYTSGDVLHAEFTATKTVGKWTFGPIAYYAGQVSNDIASASYYGGTINTNRYNVLAAGALVGYEFGPAALNVWATQEFSTTASGGRSSPRSPCSTNDSRLNDRRTSASAARDFIAGRRNVFGIPAPLAASLIFRRKFRLPPAS
jgi:hypothetical protein